MLYFWGNCATCTHSESEVFDHFIPDTVSIFNVPLQPNSLVFAAANDVILAHLSSAKIIKRNRTVHSLRKTPIAHNGITYLISHPYDVYSLDYAKAIEYQIDVNIAKRYKQHHTLVPPRIPVEVVYNLDTILRNVPTTGTLDIAIDLETYGRCYDVTSRILCLSLCHDGVHGYVVLFPNVYDYPQPGTLLYDQLVTLCTSPHIKLRLANGKYDCQWIKQHWGITVTNFVLDTLLIGSMLDENRGNSLKMHAHLYTSYGGYSDGFDAQYDKKAMHTVPTDQLVQYAGSDAVVCYQTATVLKDQLIQVSEHIRTLQQRGNEPYWDIIHSTPVHLYTYIVMKAMRIFEKIEENGVYVDREYYSQLAETVTQELHVAHKAGLAYIPQAIQNTYADNLSLTRAAMLAAYIYGPVENGGLNLTPVNYTKVKGAPSTAIEDLLSLGDYVLPEQAVFFECVKTYSKLAKTKSTFIDGFMEHVQDDNKLHPTYFLFKGIDDFGLNGGTTTARASTKGPSWHTLTKHGDEAKRLRKGYVAPPGYKIVQADMSQLELRLAAYFTQDPVMLEAYKNKHDLHALMGARIMGITFEEFMALEPDMYKAARQLGKTSNFSLLYGAGWRRFQKQSKLQYGVVLSEDEAKRIYAIFHETYTKNRVFQYAMLDFARRYEFVITPFGRMCHLPLINSEDRVTRQKMQQKVVNRIIQSTGTDLLTFALIQLDKLFPDVLLFGTVHDALQLYVPEEHVDEYVPRIKHTIEHLPLKEVFNWDIYNYVALPVDMEIGDNLGSMSPMS